MRVVRVSSATSGENRIVSSLAAREGEVVDVVDVADVDAALVECRRGDVDAIVGPPAALHELACREMTVRGAIRHEVTNHLTPILGYAEVLASTEVGRDDVTRDRLESIAAHAIAIRDYLLAEGRPAE